MIEVTFEATADRMKEISDQCKGAGIDLTYKLEGNNRHLLEDMLKRMVSDNLDSAAMFSDPAFREYTVNQSRTIHAEVSGEIVTYRSSVPDEEAAVYIRARFPESKTACLAS